MTHEDFISLVKQPQMVTDKHVSDLKEIVGLYPYFTTARLFLTKSLQLSNNIQFQSNLNTTSVYCSNRRWFYYFIYPEKIISNEPYRHERVSKSSGNYFDLMDAIESEGGDTKQSLKNMAEKLKSARAMVMKTPEPKLSKSESLVTKTILEKPQNAYFEPKTISIIERFSEENAKKLIKERKYSEAIEILKGLNLNNPKKSVYFADQIRFLEKVISNTKK
jgi:hypothetical protein